MLRVLSHFIISKLLSHTDDKFLIDTCEYGCEILLYTILSTAGLLLIGILTGYSLETTVIILIFYILQSNGGGYHATSHITCFVTMVIGLLLAELLLFFPFSTLQYLSIGCISFTVLMLIPVHLNKNKEYLSDRLPIFINHSRLISLIIFIGAIFFLLLPCLKIFNSCCIALLLSSVSRSYAKILEIREVFASL